MEWIWIIVCIVGLAVTAFREYSARKDSEELQAIHDCERRVNAGAMETMVRVNGISADMTIDTSCTSLVLDRKAGRLEGISDGKKVSWPLAELQSASLEDRSQQYIHAQEMEQYYTGIRRDSMYNPWGNHKRREVKAGHEDFRAFTGSTVYGIALRNKNGETTELPFFRGDGATFWTEGSRLKEAGRFIRELDMAIRAC